MYNARTIFKVLVWICASLAVPIIAVSIQVIEQLPRKGFPQNLYDTTLGFFFLPGWPIILTCSILGALLLATLITGIVVLRNKEDEVPTSSGPTTTNTIGNSHGSASQIGSTSSSTNIVNSPGAIVYPPQAPVDSHSSRTEQQKGLLSRYLNTVISKHKDVNPTGISLPQAMRPINVPLDEIFIHIRAVSDRPIFDIGIERQKLQEEIERVRQRPDLNADEREDYIQGLKAAMWPSQQGEELLLARLSKEVKIEEVLQRLTATRSVAVLLGAPGSGKSTTLHWLALHMARAMCYSNYRLSEGLEPVQFPVFLTIGDYAKALTAPATSQQVSGVKAFFKSEWEKISPELPALLEEALLKGHCLLLFDGLDEVASDTLRDRVRKDLYDFISLYPPDQDDLQVFNRVLITSRIVGFEPGPFAPFALYTLLDLNDEQIEQFLSAWCPAVEAHLERSQQGMQEALTEQQAQRVQQEGQSQRDRLLEALQHNPGIRRLAVNPLMLTILALIQKSGRRLPHRRIELYKTITLTLLDNWNQLSGRVIFSPEQCDLAEEALSEFAYRLHSRDLPLTQREVFAITREAMARYYHKQPEQIQRSEVETFIATLRSSSSLFVERGQGLYGFLHRTFQEYYVMRYLVDTQHYPLIAKQLSVEEDLKAFVREKCHRSTWHEPLLLLVAYKSEQKDRDERKQATTLIQTMLDTHESADALLQRHLLLAASALTDCNAWYIDAALQHEVANRLFDIYGDAYGRGRYTGLQEDIEKTALLWLRGQPQGSSQDPPLLEAWQAALCNHTQSQRQYGAVRLLAFIAHNLPTCPAVVLSILLPPLLHLAGVQEWYRQELTCPAEIRSRLFNISARPASTNIVDSALVTLRLLEAQGPAGWLHSDWLRWSEEEPDLLQRLTFHALELKHLLTPAAFPANNNDPNWNRQLEIGGSWQRLARQEPGSPQTRLLQASTAARYPQAILFKRLLRAERSSRSPTWQGVWNLSLQQEMQRGCAATYQPCFFLRLLLAQDNKQQQQRLATNLIADMKNQVTQIQALKTLANLYLLGVRVVLGVRDALDVLGVRDVLGVLGVRDVLGVLGVLDVLDVRGVPGVLDVLGVRGVLNQEQLVQLLCGLLLSKEVEVSAVASLALYSLLTRDNQISTELKQQIQEALTALERQSITAEQQYLSRMLQQRLSRPQVARSVGRQLPPGTPDQLLLQLHALQQQQAVLNRSNLEELLAACTDRRATTKQTWESLGLAQIIWGEEGGSVAAYAWEMLSRAWHMNKAAQQTVVEALDDDDSLICAAAALLLQHGKDLSPATKQAAEATITRLLADEEKSHRLFDQPWLSDYTEERLDDVLFATLGALAEGEN